MPSLRTLTLWPLLLLSWLSSTAALAESLYQVELIVFRQGSELMSAGQLPPENWAHSAIALDANNSRSTALNAEAARLNPANGYQVLLHKAWAQSVGDSPSNVAFSTGTAVFGHYPVQGQISLKQGRTLELNADIWVNQLEQSGLISDSERIKQGSNLKSGELTFLDGGSLGLLIKVSPL